MIQIDDTDMPINVAEKLIMATMKISDDKPLIKYANKCLGGDGQQDMFDVDELLEISDYLRTYCEHASKGR